MYNNERGSFFLFFLLMGPHLHPKATWAKFGLGSGPVWPAESILNSMTMQIPALFGLKLLIQWQGKIATVFLLTRDFFFPLYI